MMDQYLCSTPLLREFPIEDVSVPEFESALVSAVGHAGHLIHHRSFPSKFGHGL